MDLWSCCGNLHGFPQAPAWFLVSKLALLFIPPWEKGGWGLGLGAVCLLDKQSSLWRGGGRELVAAAWLPAFPPAGHRNQSLCLSAASLLPLLAYSCHSCSSKVVKVVCPGPIALGQTDLKVLCCFNFKWKNIDNLSRDVTLKWCFLQGRSFLWSPFEWNTVWTRPWAKPLEGRIFQASGVTQSLMLPSWKSIPHPGTCSLCRTVPFAYS